MKSLVLLVLLATIVNAAEYYKECDFNNNGKIDTRETYKADGIPKEIAKKETKCRGNKNLEESKKINARLDEEIERLEQELEKVEQKLENSKQKLGNSKQKLENSKQKLENSKQKNIRLREEWEIRRKWIMAAIKTISCNTGGPKSSKSDCEMNLKVYNETGKIIDEKYGGR